MPIGNAGTGVMGIAGMAGTGSGGATGSGGTGSVGASGKPIPCNVAKVVATNCGSCHSNPPTNAAPMALVSAEDFQRDYTVQFYTQLKGQTMKMNELVKRRINDTGSPMPPGGGMKPTDLAVLNDWLGAGAVAGTEADKTCDAVVPILKPGEDPLCAPQTGEVETCYEFQTHGGQEVGDTSKYSISTGEHYEQFYFKIPWGGDVQGTRFGAVFDNQSVLHHWLLFSTAGHTAAEEGTHETVIGTQLGDSSQLLGGWAVGGKDVCFPKHMGLQLPAAGGMLNLQWHYYNSTGTPQDDASKVLVCTVPAGTRPNTGSLTWLGTENLYMPPGQMSDKTGNCPNDSTGQIHIWGFWPHMHNLGRHMKSTVTRAATGMTETVFDKPFDFNKQIHYPLETELVLEPNDVITSTCTFDNITDAPVDFGPSTEEEMCYQFAFSYPAGELDNGVPSLIGATNVCWMLGDE